MLVVFLRDGLYGKTLAGADEEHAGEGRVELDFSERDGGRKLLYKGNIDKYPARFFCRCFLSLLF